MPISLRGQVHPLPGESGQPPISGRELIAIEDAFGLDALQLLACLSPSATLQPGYTRTKAIYALTWLALHRSDESWSLDQVLNEVALEELEVADEENPTKAASLAAGSDAE